MEKELADAIASAARTVQTDFEAAQDAYNRAVARQSDAQQQIVTRTKIAMVYDTLQRDFDVAEGMYKSILASVEEQQASVNMTQPAYRIVDRAAPAAEPFSPDVAKALGLGLVCAFSGATISTLFAAVQWRISRRRLAA